MEKLRLDKFISGQKNMSRTDAKKVIRRGCVKVNSVTVKDYGQLISPQTDTVNYDGQDITYKEHIYILMNKPAGVLTATEDKSRKTVVDLVPEELKRAGLFPVGRLDRDTTGMLMITDDGDFAHRIISPKSRITKSYIAELDGCVTEDMVRKFSEGVILADGSVCRPAVLEPISENTARLILCEGKYHEVKRMFGTVDLGVNKLHREAIGELRLPEWLEVGQCVEMTEKWLISVQISI